MTEGLLITIVQYVAAPLVVALIAYLNRRNAIPVFAREYVAKIGESNLVDFARSAETFKEKSSKDKAEYVRDRISRAIDDKPDSWDGIAKFLVEYAYQKYREKAAK